jgi:predicted PurR-regulated permease PerM
MSFILIIIISFYLSVQRNGLENFLKIITPVEYEDYILDLWKRSRRKIGRWIQGQILLGILVGVLVFLGLTILGVEYALTFALLAAVFELIPIFGPILASIPPIAVAFLQSPTLALAVLALFVIIQQFENHLIYPLVVRKIVGVPPILVILSLIIGVKIGGFFGILLAIPAVTVAMEFFNDMAAKKHPTSSK